MENTQLWDFCQALPKLPLVRTLEIMDLWCNNNNMHESKILWKHVHINFVIGSSLNDRYLVIARFTLVTL